MENNILGLKTLVEPLFDLKKFTPKEIENLLMFSSKPKTSQEIAELYLKSKGTTKIRAAIAGLLHECQKNADNNLHIAENRESPQWIQFCVLCIKIANYIAQKIM